MRIRPAVANGDVSDEQTRESPLPETALPNGDLKPLAGAHPAPSSPDLACEPDLQWILSCSVCQGIADVTS